MRGRLSRRGGSVLVAVGAALALFAAPAQAMPGDPEIVNLAPPSTGSTTLVRDAVDVEFTCPAYRTGAAGMIADGDAGDYNVRLALGNTGQDGRLPGPGSREFFSETAAQPIPGTANCRAELPMTWAFGPPAFYVGWVSWQVARRCPGCGNGWEPGPVGSPFLKPAIEDPVLSIPNHVYAGYLTRFGFATASDLSGATIGLQWFARTGWSDLERTQFVPGDESVFFAKLSAGHHLLRVNFFADPLAVFSTPYEEVTVLKAGRRRATGIGDDGEYRGGLPPRPSLSFEVVGGGRRLQDLKASVPIRCGATSAPEATVTARIRSARIAPDGTVAGRALQPGTSTRYVTLVGEIGHNRFQGTVTVASGACSGAAELTAGRLRRS